MGYIMKAKPTWLTDGVCDTRIKQLDKQWGLIQRFGRLGEEQCGKKGNQEFCLDTEVGYLLAI